MSIKSARERFADALFGILFSVLIVGSLLVIGDVQANQYRQVVNRIDRNSQAVVCILLISPDERNSANVNACLHRYGLSTSKGGAP